MKVTDIDIHRVTLEYDKGRADELLHYHDMTQRTIYIAHTDNGLVGYGDYDYWVDDGSEEYRRVFARLDESGSFSERASE